MSDSRESRATIDVEHIKIASTKSFAEVKAALERLVPELDQGIFALLREGESERALKQLEAGPVLARFLSRDHGSLLQIAGRQRKAVQYEIGNALTASRMTRHQLRAALYAPLRVLLYEDDSGQAAFEYDRPSSLFGQFGDERVTAVARELDASLERVLIDAAR
jgi:exonuclease VII small subunit